MGDEIYCQGVLEVLDSTFHLRVYNKHLGCTVHFCKTEEADILFRNLEYRGMSWRSAKYVPIV